MRLYVHESEKVWAAMLVGDDVPPPEPGTLKGLGFFRETPEEAERGVTTYLRCSEPLNSNDLSAGVKVDRRSMVAR